MTDRRTVLQDLWARHADDRAIAAVTQLYRKRFRLAAERSWT